MIRGKPGSGKSTLARHILQMKEADRQAGSSNTPTADAEREVLVVSFFYSFRGGEKQTNHTLMLQSLLYQLLSQDERLFVWFRELYRSLRAFRDPFRWEYADLKSVFERLGAVDTRQTIYILLDAMDESAEQQRPEILDVFSQLCLVSLSWRFKVLVATRPLPPGQIDEKASRYQVMVLEQKNRGDIEKVVKSGVQDLRSLDVPSLTALLAWQKDTWLKNLEAYSCG